MIVSLSPPFDHEGILPFSSSRLESASAFLSYSGGTWTKHETTAKNLIVYGKTTTGTEPLLPGLQATFESSAAPPGIYNDACVIIVEATAEFESVFGGSRLPSIYGALGDGNPITLRSRTEERYIGE